MGDFEIKNQIVPEIVLSNLVRGTRIFVFRNCVKFNRLHFLIRIFPQSNMFVGGLGKYIIWVVIFASIKLFRHCHSIFNSETALYISLCEFIESLLTF